MQRTIIVVYQHSPKADDLPNLISRLNQPRTALHILNLENADKN